VSACGDDAPPAEDPIWQTVLENLPGALLGVFGSGPDDVYMVGADGDGAGSLVYHFDGTQITKLDPGTQGDLWWVRAVAPDDVRLVGEAGLVLRYQPSTNTFDRLVAPTTPDTLFGTWGASSTDVWYVGGQPTGPRSLVWRDTGAGAAAVMDLPVSTSSATVFKVHGFADGTVWFVGQRGGTWRFDGSTWTDLPSGTTEGLLTVHGARSDRVFAVGGNLRGVILGYDGAGWVDETPAGAAGVNGVFATSDDEAYAAGFNGSIWKRSNGSWAPFTPESSTLEDLHSVWVDSAGVIWAVGGLLSADPPTRGVLVRYGPPLEL
jgi:hypothetical protein